MPRDAERLAHMLAAARRAIELLRLRTRSDLDDDDVLALAVARLLEILGEAAKSVSPETRAAYPNLPWSEMAGTRDRLIHGYFTLDMDVVWDTVRFDLPGVINQLESPRTEPDK